MPFVSSHLLLRASYRANLSFGLICVYCLMFCLCCFILSSICFVFGDEKFIISLYMNSAINVPNDFKLKYDVDVLSLNVNMYQC